MYRAKMKRYGGAGSSQGTDAASGLFGALSIHGSRPGGGMTPISLASESEFPEIARTMKEMVAKHNDVNIQRLQLPLRSVFTNTVRSAGCPNPDFSLQEDKGYFQVTISMVVGSKTSTIRGEYCANSEAAETMAIERALVTLQSLHNIVLVDISARKKKAAIQTGRHLYMKACSVLFHLDSMIKQWSRSLDHLSLVETFALQNLKVGNSVQKEFTDALYTSVLILKGGNKSYIANLDGRLRDLRAEKEKYAAASRSEPICIHELPKKKTYYHDKEALAHFLKWLNLEECQYSEEADDGGMYLGAVQLTLRDNHDIMIWAKKHKGTIEKAHNCAAREAILYLEDLFKVYVAASNHNDAVLADQETFVWKGLFEQSCSLGENVFFLWNDMLTRFAAVSEQHNKAHVQLAQRARVGKEMGFIQDLLRRLDIASAKCNESYVLAATKFASLK